MRVSTSGYSQVKFTEKLTAPCSVEFTLTDYSTPSETASVIIFQYTNGETTPNQSILQNNASSYNALGTIVSHSLPKNVPIRIEYDTNQMRVYENDVLVASGSNNIGFPTRFEVHEGSPTSRYAVYKDLKIKPL